MLGILHETALDSSHNTIDSVKASLEKLNHLYLEQMDNNTHLPGAQPTTEEVKFKAMQAEVKQLQSEVTKLSQDQSATSANGPSNKKSKRCCSCGAEGHFANDPSCPNYKSREASKPAPGPSILKTSSSDDKKVQFKAPKGSKGLDPEVNKKTTQLIRAKLKELGPKKEIPADAVPSHHC